MNVENGGRIELRLDTSTSDSAEYELQLHTGGKSFHTLAQVGASAGGKQVQLGAWSPESEPPAWLVEDARAALKAALRTSQAEGRWPRRITRWRPEPTP
jgi:hypothetical protein